MKTDKLAIELVLASVLAIWTGSPLHAEEESPFPLEATMICAFRPAPATAARTKIFVIRGGGGYFPNLGTVINRKFEQQGLEVVDFRYHQKSTAAATIANAYRSGQLPHGVIMVGYSLGGCGVIDVARTLQSQGIPVRLLYLIETINPVQTVPANVQECFNLYHFPALLGSAVRADSKQTKLVNFEAYRDGGLGLEYSHFTMPFVEEVHEMIASKLIEAIRTSSPAAGAQNGLTPVSGGNVQSGLFQRNRRKF